MGKRKCINTLEMAKRRVKWTEIWDSWDRVTFDPVIPRLIWNHWCTCLEMARNSKTAAHRAKWAGIWDSCVKIEHIFYMGNLSANSVQFHLECD